MRLSFVVISMVVLIFIDKIQGFSVRFKFSIAEPTPRTRTFIKKEISEIHHVPIPPNHQIVKINKKEARQVKLNDNVPTSSPLTQIENYVNAFAYYMARLQSYIQERAKELMKKNEWQCLHNRPARAYPIINIKTWDVIPHEKSPLRKGVNFKIRCKKQWGLQDILF